MVEKEKRPTEWEAALFKDGDPDQMVYRTFDNKLVTQQGEQVTREDNLKQGVFKTIAKIR